MHRHELTLRTGSTVVTDITDEVRRFARDSAGRGLLHVLVPHATAGIALMETDSGSESDLAEALERLLPRDDRYAHRHGSTGHGADHVLPAFVSPSLTLVVDAGEVELGTWQRIVVVDTNRDNEVRRVRLTLFPAG